MQNTIFKINSMNDIQNYIINNKLEDTFRLRERDLIYSHGAIYSFYKDDKLIEVFEVESSSKVDEPIAYQYMLGFLDSYVSIKGTFQNSLQSKLNR